MRKGENKEDEGIKRGKGEYTGKWKKRERKKTEKGKEGEGKRGKEGRDLKRKKEKTNYIEFP